MGDTCGGDRRCVAVTRRPLGGASRLRALVNQTAPAETTEGMVHGGDPSGATERAIEIEIQRVEMDLDLEIPTYIVGDQVRGDRLGNAHGGRR